MPSEYWGRAAEALLALAFKQETERVVGQAKKAIGIALERSSKLGMIIV